MDFGLMTDVTPEQSIALVEYIAHLSAKDWEAVTRDLLTLGFIPEGTPAFACLPEPAVPCGFSGRPCSGAVPRGHPGYPRLHVLALGL